MKKLIRLLGLSLGMLSLVLLAVGLFLQFRLAWIAGIVLLLVAVVVGLIEAALVPDDAGRAPGDVLSPFPHMSPSPLQPGSREDMPGEGSGYR